MTEQSDLTQNQGKSEVNAVQRNPALRFLLTQLIHTAITIVVLGILLLGAAQAGALESILPAASQSAPEASTGYSDKGYTINYQGRLADVYSNPIDNISPGINITFSLYITDTGGPPLWSETHFNVPVSQGLFSARLGSINPLTEDLLPDGDLWLGIQVEDDPEMTPRVLLDHTLRAIEAETTQKLDLEGDYFFSDTYGRSAHINYPDIDVDYDTETEQVYINNVSAHVQGAEQALEYNGVIGSSAHPFPDGGFELQLMVEAHSHGWMAGELTGDEAKVYIGGHEHPHWLPPDQHYQPGGLTVYANGNARLDGTFDGGAIIENNLQSAEEQATNRIDRFSEGDVLCWHDEHLELCAQSGDPLIQAVADERGKPIILGAEPIKVLGPVKAGDLLVASDVPGYAMVDNNPRPGIVIAQALEDLEGGWGLIKAMIRKF